MNQLVPHRARRAARPAFSLVELLCVIAIITLLLALLFPALKGARSKAHATACTGNLAQLSVACHAWMADHNGNFLGPFADSGWWLVDDGGMGTYGGWSLSWYNMLGRFNYIGKPIKIRYPHIAQGWYGVCDQWKYPLLRDPGEPEWTTMPENYTSPNGPYMGAPYTAWLHSYNNNSYGMNWYVSQVTQCMDDRGGTPRDTNGDGTPDWSPNWSNGYCCSRTYCGFGAYAFENMCSATGYKTLKAGMEPSKALVIMDMAMPNWIQWSGNYFYYDALGYTSWNPTNVVHITNEAILHAFRHNGQANGIFHDGHVEAFRPMEYVPVHQRLRLDLF